MFTQARTAAREIVFTEFFRLFEQVEEGFPLTDDEQKLFEEMIGEFITELALAKAYSQALRAGTVGKQTTH